MLTLEHAPDAGQKAGSTLKQYDRLDGDDLT